MSNPKTYDYSQPPCCLDFKELAITKEIDKMSREWTIYTTNMDGYGPRFHRLRFCPFCGSRKEN